MFLQGLRISIGRLNCGNINRPMGHWATGQVSHMGTKTHKKPEFGGRTDRNGSYPAYATKYFVNR